MWDAVRCGDRLKLARRERALSLRALSELASDEPNKMKSWISRVENGKRKEISAAHLVAVCEALHVRVEWVMLGVEPMWEEGHAPRQQKTA